MKKDTIVAWLQPIIAATYLFLGIWISRVVQSASTYLGIIYLFIGLYFILTILVLFFWRFKLIKVVSIGIWFYLVLGLAVTSSLHFEEKIRDCPGSYGNIMNPVYCPETMVKLSWKVLIYRVDFWLATIPLWPLNSKLIIEVVYLLPILVWFLSLISLHVINWIYKKYKYNYSKNIEVVIQVLMVLFYVALWLRFYSYFIFGEDKINLIDTITWD